MGIEEFLARKPDILITASRLSKGRGELKWRMEKFHRKLTIFKIDIQDKLIAKM